MSRFVGADPVGLVGLADTLDHCAGRRGLATTEIADTVARYDRSTESMAWMLTVVERALGERADDLRWRAAAIEDGQQVTTPFLVYAHSSHLAEFAAPCRV